MVLHFTMASNLSPLSILFAFKFLIKKLIKNKEDMHAVLFYEKW